MEADLHILILIINKFKHHFDLLVLTFVRSILANPVNHNFRDVVEQLVISFWLVVRFGLHIRFDYDFRAIFTSLVPFG